MLEWITEKLFGSKADESVQQRIDHMLNNPGLPQQARAQLKAQMENSAFSALVHKLAASDKPPEEAQGFAKVGEWISGLPGRLVSAVTMGAISGVAVGGIGYGLKQAGFNAPGFASISADDKKKLDEGRLEGKKVDDVIPPKTDIQQAVSVATGVGLLSAGVNLVMSIFQNNRDINTEKQLWALLHPEHFQGAQHAGSHQNNTTYTPNSSPVPQQNLPRQMPRNEQGMNA